ncbi:MAG: hypothetical protein PUP91_10035 [Rhizonema sp. PD37]|nr:hypothetical protein [Rhizonema sp. PD37]
MPPIPSMSDRPHINHAYNRRKAETRCITRGREASLPQTGQDLASRLFSKSKAQAGS